MGLNTEAPLRPDCTGVSLPWSLGCSCPETVAHGSSGVPEPHSYICDLSPVSIGVLNPPSVSRS